MDTRTDMAPAADPVTLEIIRDLLVAILDEGEVNLERTAFSPIIYEVKDYCIGFLDKAGNTIAQSRGGVPTFMADLGEPVRDGLEIYGESGFDPGDVLLINYAAVCGQHLNNVVLYMPVHWQGKLVGFSATRAHWTDVGGSVSGSLSTKTTEIYQEGLQIRSVKVHKKGKPDEEILRLIRHNIRFPELSFGDMAAQIAACTLTSERWLAIITKYGWETVEASILNTWDQSEAFVREQISMIPPGRYEAESFLDDDAIDLDTTIPIKVAVTVGEGQITVDFTGTAAQTRGPMNGGRSAGLAAARVAFKSVVMPALPPCEGAFRPLKIVLPEGTLISATDNAAMGKWNLPIKTVIDTIYLAFSQVVPDRVAAGHHAGQGLYSFYGRNAETGQRFSTMDTVLGGWGAQPAADGFSPLKTVTHGDTRNIPLEVEETFSPILIESYRWRPDSAGAGEWRGGLGLCKVYRVLHDCHANFGFERTKCPPWGLFGGNAAKVGGVVIHRPGKTQPERVLKATAVPLEAGTRLEILSGGGGGRGPAFKRPIARVLEDVRQGYVTPEGARDDYGVVIHGTSLEVDEQATEKLRKLMEEHARAAVG